MVHERGTSLTIGDDDIWQYAITYIYSNISDVPFSSSMRWHVAHNTVGRGHLYQGRFKSFPVQEDEYFYALCRYVERNALTAQVVQRAEDWRWGSLWARRHGSEELKSILSGWPPCHAPELGGGCERADDGQGGGRRADVYFEESSLRQRGVAATAGGSAGVAAYLARRRPPQGIQTEKLAASPFLPPRRNVPISLPSLAHQACVICRRGQYK